PPPETPVDEPAKPLAEKKDPPKEEPGKAPEKTPDMPAEAEKEPEPDEPEAKPLVAKEVRGRVKIASRPPGAKVLLDGEEIGVTETRLLDFELGPVELVLKREGYRDYVHRGVVKEGTQIVN